jgi:cyclase
LNKRIIPCLDVKGGRVVKGVNFNSLVDAGDPVEIAKRYNELGADELVLLDITATIEERKTIIDVIKEVARVVTIPFIVGGGIKTFGDISDILNAGADKVSINSIAVKNPDFINEVSLRFGKPSIVIAIDVSWNGKFYEVYINGGKKATGIDAFNWAKEVEMRGAGEILLTSIDKDGKKSGYDLSLTKKIVDAVKIPVIASGGAGKAEDFLDVFKEAGADAALAASIFHFQTVKIEELKKYLIQNGVSVRL